MGLGVLQPKAEHVPGTVYVYDDERREAELVQRDSQLKRDKTGKIILVPQPSDDPNDPLNWPLWKRDLVLGIISFVAVICTTASPLLAADSVTLAVDFKKTFEDAALLTGYHLCGVGVGGVLAVPTARVWGKRHLFILGTLLMAASSAWGGSTVHGHSYRSLVWARVFQGVALAPFEGLVNACVGDLYFVHERGKRMALTNVALFGAAFLTPVFVGMIAHNPHLGWQWSFYLISIFMAAGFILIFFFVPETAFRRPDHCNIDRVTDAYSRESLNSSHSESAPHSEKGDRAPMDPTPEPIPPKKSYARTLLPLSGTRLTDESFFKLLLRPFPLFLHPGIAYACLIQGVIIGWTVMTYVVLAAVFLGPPLFFTELQTGYMSTGAFIGSVIGLILSGLLSDSINKLMIRWNHGLYEPEFRILLVFPMLIFCALGLYGFGITAAKVADYGWIVPEIFLCFMLIGLVMGAVAASLYIVDAHRDLAVEAFTCLLIFKNMFSFLLTYFSFTWIFAGGIRHVFIILGSLQIVICLFSVPMYIFGKMNRALMSRHDLLALAHLR